MEIEIIKRRALGFEGEDGYGSYQYLYRRNQTAITLIKVFSKWKTHSQYEWSDRFSQTFNKIEEAEDYIITALILNSLEGLIAWKIAKQNMIIVDD